MTPEQCEFVNVLSHFYLQHGQVDKALVLLRAAVVLMPEQPTLLKMLAYAHLRAGESDASLEVIRRYQAATGEHRDGSPIQLVRARALWQLGRTDEARALFNRFVTARRLPVP